MIVGHKKQLDFLKRITESEKIPHAFLFSGQEKLGKRTIAVEFASLVLNQSPFLHPDFTLIKPVENQILISQIRELIWKLSLKPTSAQYKIAIIDEAHLMSKDSQNCLLKTLEEPRNSVLILITGYPELLLPTIISRCEILKFYPVGEKEIEELFRKAKFSEDEIKEISDIALGRPGVVADFILNPKKLKEERNRLDELKKILDQDLPSHFQYAKRLSTDPELNETLKLMFFYFRNILMKSIKESTKLNLMKIEDILNTLQDTYFLISNTNVNKKLALEILMLKF